MPRARTTTGCAATSRRITEQRARASIRVPLRGALLDHPNGSYSDDPEVVLVAAGAGVEGLDSDELEDEEDGDDDLAAARESLR